MALTILYRGSLSSCNYACDYCPFSKNQNSRSQLARDKADLERFVFWVKQQTQKISILFTPWGEALIRRYYREAIINLSQIPHVNKVVIQTNFSCSTSWLEQGIKDKIAFWITYHPTEIPLEKFLGKCHQLDKQLIQYSVGIVGVKDNFDAIKQCRKELPDNRYLWVNAYKRETNYYEKNELQFLTSIDPYFDLNNQSYASHKKTCLTGEKVISVNGDGDITRCHFIKAKLGNIYEKNFMRNLKPRLCSNLNCNCYIGYIHMPHLSLEKIYANRILERIPKAHE